MDYKQDLTHLTQAMRKLHQRLVEVARREYEKEWGEVDTGQLLQLLIKHPGFEWLRELSSLMSFIDELVDQEDLLQEQIEAVYAQTRKLLINTEDDPSPFSQRYRAILQTEPFIVMEHAAVRKALALTS